MKRSIYLLLAGLILFSFGSYWLHRIVLRKTRRHIFDVYEFKDLKQPMGRYLYRVQSPLLSAGKNQSDRYHYAIHPVHIINLTPVALRVWMKADHRQFLFVEERDTGRLKRIGENYAYDRIRGTDIRGAHHVSDHYVKLPLGYNRLMVAGVIRQSFPVGVNYGISPLAFHIRLNGPSVRANVPSILAYGLRLLSIIARSAAALLLVAVLYLRFFRPYFPAVKRLLATNFFIVPLIFFAGHILVTQAYQMRRADKIVAFVTGGWADAEAYKNIAENGRFFANSDRTAPEKPSARHVALFPGYSLVLGAVNLWVRHIDGAAFFTNYALFYLACCLLFFWVRSFFDLQSAVFSLAAFVCFPTSWYFQLSYPYHLTIVWMLLYLIISRHPLEREWLRQPLLFITAVFLSLTYPAGFLFFLGPLTEQVTAAFFQTPGVFRSTGLLKSTAARISMTAAAVNIPKTLLTVLPFFLGIVLYGSYLYFTFGDFSIVEKLLTQMFNHAYANPFAVIARSFTDAANVFNNYETLIFIIYTGAAITFFSSRLPAGLILFLTAGLLLPPLTGSMVGNYRFYTILFPVYIMIGVSRRPLPIKAAFLFFTLIIGLKKYFYPYLLEHLI